MGRRPGNRAAILCPKFMDAGAMAVPIASVRFGHSTARRRGARRPPREDPAQARRALAGGFDNRNTGSSKRSGCSLQPGMTLLDRKIAARLFRRCRRPVDARIMPDSYVSSMGSAFTRPDNHQLRTAMVSANFRGCTRPSCGSSWVKLPLAWSWHLPSDIPQRHLKMRVHGDNWRYTRWWSWACPCQCHPACRER